MIDIKQYSPLGRELEVSITKLGETNLKLDGSAIKNDLLRLENMSKRTFSKADLENVRNLIKYENRLLGKEKTGLTINWMFEKGLPKAYPLGIRYYPEYGIDAMNYIMTSKDEKLVEVSYSGVADLIALEIMHRDLDDSDDLCSHEIIEEKMKDIGIVGINPFSTIKERLFKDYSPYKCSKVFKINDSPYIDREKNKIIDYFGHREFNIDRYYDVVNYSTEHAMALVYRGLYRNKLGVRQNWKLVAINNDRIIFLVNNSANLDVEKDFGESVVVRVFGRRFEVEPSIKVY